MRRELQGARRQPYSQRVYQAYLTFRAERETLDRKRVQRRWTPPRNRFFQHLRHRVADAAAVRQNSRGGIAHENFGGGIRLTIPSRSLPAA